MLQQKIFTTSILIFCSFFGQLTFGQADKYDKSFKLTNGMQIVQTDGKYGYLNESGKEVIPLIYDDAFNFSATGIAIVMKENRYGTIDKKGKEVLPLEYLHIGYNSNFDTYVMKNENGYQIYDGNCSPINDVIYNDIYAFNSSGCAKAQLDDKWGLVKYNGEIASRFNKDKIYKFTNGYAIFQIKGSSKSKYGFISENGNSVGRLYDDAFDFSEDGLARVYNESMIGYLGKDGEIAIDFKFSGGSDFINARANVILDGQYGSIDINGEFTPQESNIEWESVAEESEGLRAVTIFDKRGFIDANNKLVIGLKYDACYAFSNGVVGVKIGEYKGYIDKEDNIVIPIEYDWVSEITEGYILVVKSGSYEFFNPSGEKFGSGPFEEADVFSGGYAKIVKDGKAGWLDLNGEITWGSEKPSPSEIAVSTNNQSDFAEAIAQDNALVKKSESAIAGNLKNYKARMSVSSSPKKITSLETLYNFELHDTIQKCPAASSHLAMIRDGNYLYTLDTWVDNFDKKTRRIYNGGFIIRKYSKSSNGQLIQEKVSDPVSVKNNEYDNSINYNTFTKTEFGFLAAGSNLMVAYDKDLNVLSGTSLPMHIQKAAHIAGTSEIITLCFTEDLGTYVRIYNYKTDQWNKGTSIGNTNNQLTKYSYNHNFYLRKDGNIFIALKQGKNQVYGALNLDKLRENSSISDALLWQKEFPCPLLYSEVRNGTIEAFYKFYTGNGSVCLGVFSANINANSKDDFMSSLVNHGNENGDEILEVPSLVRKSDRGTYYVLSQGRKKFGHNELRVIGEYDNEARLINQYRIKSPYDSQIGYFFDYYFESGSRDQQSYIERAYLTSITIFENEDEITNNGIRVSLGEDPILKTFGYDYLSWDICQGFQEGEILILSANSIISADYRKLKESEYSGSKYDARLKRENPDAVVNTDYSTDEETNTNTTSTTTSNPTTFTVVNETGNILNMMNARGSSLGSMNDGSSKTFDCDVVVYEALLSESGTTWNVKGRLIANGEDVCGQTIVFE